MINEKNFAQGPHFDWLLFNGMHQFSLLKKKLPAFFPGTAKIINYSL
jgi:hypothetical protein